MNISDLPQELKEKIYSNLNLQDLGLIARLSKESRFSSTRALNERKWDDSETKAGLFFVNSVVIPYAGTNLPYYIDVGFNIDKFIEADLTYLFKEKEGLVLYQHKFQKTLKGGYSNVYIDVTFTNNPNRDRSKLIYAYYDQANVNREGSIEIELKNYSEVIDIIALLLYNDIKVFV